MKSNLNANLYTHALAATPVKGLCRYRKGLCWGYCGAFILSLLLHLAYLLGLWLQLLADGTAGAQSNLWFCLVFTLGLSLGAILNRAQKYLAALLCTEISAAVLLLGVWGNLWWANDTLPVAKGVLYLAFLALLLLLAFAALYGTAALKHQAAVQATYNRMADAVYRKAVADAEGTPSATAIAAAMDAYAGQDPTLYGKTHLSRSEKSRLRKS